MAFLNPRDINPPDKKDTHFVINNFEVPSYEE